MIKKHGGVISSSLNLSSLAKVTEGYTAGRMETAIQSVLTERRIKQVSPVVEQLRKFYLQILMIGQFLFFE